MCRTLNVRASGYFAWWRRPENRYIQADITLTALIRRIHQQSRGTYGAPRVQAILAEERQRVNRAWITRLMKVDGLKVCCKRKFRTTTNSKHQRPVAESLLNRKFAVGQPSKKWVTDITYLPTHEGWIYLAVVMDLFSRKIVGWAMRRTLHTELVIAALTVAQYSQRPEQGILHHSDQGSVRQ